MPEIDCFMAIRPLNNDVFCGDTGIIKKFDNEVFIGIVDALGHGERAHRVAVDCKGFLERNYHRDLVKIMEDLDKHIRDTSGVVAGLCHLDLETGELSHVGVGDTSAVIFGSSNVRLLQKPGIAGYKMPTPRINKLKLDDGDVLVLYTDGVKTFFDQEDYSELLVVDAKTLATHIIEQFGRETDDAACIALRYHR